MNVEQNAVEPKPLGLVNPLLPTTFRFGPFGREGRLVRRHAIKYSSIEQRRSLLVHSSNAVFGFGSRSSVSTRILAAFWSDRAYITISTSAPLCQRRSSGWAILSATTPPFFADFASAHFIQLYLYAHRVDGLQSGVYRHWPDPAELEQIKSGDQRVAAAGLGLGQDLAGNACVALSMIGDLERAVRAHGDPGYRYVHFEVKRCATCREESNGYVGSGL